MFENLFLDSLKNEPNQDLNDRIKRRFADRHKESFKPQDPKSVEFFNKDSVMSSYSKDIKFTNYYSDKTKPEIISRLQDLNSDLNLVKPYDMNNVNVNKRVEQILKLYLEDFEINELDDDSIKKVSLTNDLSQEEGVRVYILMNIPLDIFEIILIDPYHLVLPSKQKYKGKMISKEESLKMNFNNNKDNDLCISEIFLKEP